MKKMNMKKRFWNMELQLFAGEGDTGGDGGSDNEDDDPQDDSEDDDSDDDHADEKKFTQRDVDDAVKKRLAREKRKWQRDQQRKASGSGTGSTGKAGDSENSGDADIKLKEAENRAMRAETRAACFEAGVDKDAIDDVTALAHSYMAADEDLDLEDAIEKVVKKYPHFKKSAGNTDDDNESKGKSWGERQRGSGKKLTGVEVAFLKKNPGLKY